MELHLVSTFIGQIRRALSWRWRHLGEAAACAVWVYLFPAYCTRWRWEALVLLIVVMLGYGNIKYMLLCLPFILADKPNNV